MTFTEVRDHGIGQPDLAITRVECPTHGDTWFFWSEHGNDMGECEVDGCRAHGVWVKYIPEGQAKLLYEPEEEGMGTSPEPGVPVWLIALTIGLFLGMAIGALTAA